MKSLPESRTVASNRSAPPRNREEARGARNRQSFTKSHSPPRPSARRPRRTSPPLSALRAALQDVSFFYVVPSRPTTRSSPQSHVKALFTSATTLRRKTGTRPRTTTTTSPMVVSSTSHLVSLSHCCFLSITRLRLIAWGQSRRPWTGRSGEDRSPLESTSPDRARSPTRTSTFAATLALEAK